MRNAILILLTSITLSISAQRSTSIEIEIDMNLMPQSLLDSNILDIEYSSKEGYYILWIHPDSTYKPFKKEYFIYLGAAKSAYNRKSKTDHLNIYEETSGALEEFDIEVDGVKYKNLKFSNLRNKDLSKIKFKRNLNGN